MLDEDIKHLLTDLDMGSYVKEFEEIDKEGQKQQSDPLPTHVSPRSEKKEVEELQRTVTGWHKPLYRTILPIVGAALVAGACGWGLPRYFSNNEPPSEQIHEPLVAQELVQEELPDLSEIIAMSREQDQEVQEMDQEETPIPVDPSDAGGVWQDTEQPLVVTFPMPIPVTVSPRVAQYLDPILQLTQERKRVLQGIGQNFSELLTSHAEKPQPLLDQELAILLARYKTEDVRLTSRLTAHIREMYTKLNREEDAFFVASVKGTLASMGCDFYDQNQFVQLRDVFEKELGCERRFEQMQGVTALEKLVAHVEEAVSFVDREEHDLVLKALFSKEKYYTKLRNAVEQRLHTLLFDTGAHLPEDAFTQENKSHVVALLTLVQSDEATKDTMLAQFELLNRFIAIKKEELEKQRPKVFALPAWLSVTPFSEFVGRGISVVQETGEARFHEDSPESMQ